MEAAQHSGQQFNKKILFQKLPLPSYVTKERIGDAAKLRTAVTVVLQIPTERDEIFVTFTAASLCEECSSEDGETRFRGVTYDVGKSGHFVTFIFARDANTVLICPSEDSGL